MVRLIAGTAFNVDSGYCRSRFNSKDGAIDRRAANLSNSTKLSFNSKDGAIDSYWKDDAFQLYLCFNSKDGAIDRFTVVIYADTALYVSFQRWLRLIG